MGGIEALGIENMRIYGTAASLDLAVLATARGFDIERLHNDLRVVERGVNPSWEDPVTMAVNVAKPLLSGIDPDKIGLLIIATETGLDYEKSISTWVHKYLGLPSDCRHFEVKSACYAGTLALKQSLAWLKSGMLPPDKKALVITTDQSLISLNKPWEYVHGAGAVALIVSNQPDFLIVEQDCFGFYTQESSDVIRPLPWVETGNSEDSLYSYMDGLMESYEAYLHRVEGADEADFFDYLIYHVPFAGISFRAHKQLMQRMGMSDKTGIANLFELKTRPSLYFPQRIGASYSGSIFIALLSLICHAEKLQAGDRVGIFSYGAGYCAEFYSGLVGTSARQLARNLNLGEELSKRQQLSLEDYEQLENTRVHMVQEPDFTPDFNDPPGLYESHYQGKQRLIYQGSKNYMRRYEWS